MPSNWLYIDTNFPAFTGEESMEEKVTSIQDYRERRARPG